MKTHHTTRSATAIKDSLISVREALEVLSGKWKIPIMISLAGGKKRFREIQCDIETITSKVLSHELKELERNKLVTRTVNQETDIIEYALTIKYKSLEKLIEGLHEWGDYHRSSIFERPISTHAILASSIPDAGNRHEK